MLFPGENRREIEEDSQTLTDEDATTHAVEEDATAAAATVTEEVGSVNADREFSATDKKFAGELAASAAERSAEPEQTDDDPRTTVTNEATGADADDGTSAAAVRTSSDVASAMLASAAAVDAMQIQHRVLGIEQQPADRMETGSNDQAIASDERKRALVDEEIIVEQHNDRDGERSDEHVAETEREPSSVEGNKKQAVEEHEMPVDESTLAETESHELPSDEQRKTGGGAIPGAPRIASGRARNSNRIQHCVERSTS
jgi:hypothetical protein